MIGRLFILLLISFRLAAQDNSGLDLGIGTRLNFSQMLITNPINSATVQQFTGQLWTPGVSAFAGIHLGTKFSLYYQISYLEKGSQSVNYFSPNNDNNVFRIDDRYRTIQSNIFLRFNMQLKKNLLYFGVGPASSYIINSYLRNSNTLFQFPPNAVIYSPGTPNLSVWGIGACAGLNIGRKTDIEINTNYDLTSVHNLMNLDTRIWATSFTVRYHFKPVTFKNLPEDSKIEMGRD
ncbi:MAG: hypothetical protein Fur0041_15350 [Bacteroidia bacterium]